MASKIIRPFYLLLQTPTELARPVVYYAVRATRRTDALFDDYIKQTEQARLEGQSTYYMSKNEIQKWTPYVPCGPRMQVVAFDTRPYE
jgi:hypothetical protein